MDDVAREYVKSGKDINQLMNMPYAFVLEILSEQAKPNETKSLIAAFGG